VPLHPRTKKCIDTFNLHSTISSSVQLIDPLGYYDMLMLEKHAHSILTDSGGMQKEAYFQRVPCITLRNETEWTETVTSGWNQLTGANMERIVNAVENIHMPTQEISDYGTGNAAENIIQILQQHAQKL
jgi:UDP-GlcNAc3NAcA epimerase